MQLAGARNQCTVGSHHDCRVETEAVLPLGALVERGVDVDARLGGHPRGEAVGGPARKLLRLRSPLPGPAGIDGEIAAQGELLQADELRAGFGGQVDGPGQCLLVRLRVGAPALLDGGDAERSSLRSAGAGGRVEWPGLRDQLDLLSHPPDSRDAQLDSARDRASCREAWLWGPRSVSVIRPLPSMTKVVGRPVSL